MVIPGTAKAIVESIIENWKISTREIALMIGVTKEAIEHVLKGGSASFELDVQLMMFYIKLCWYKENWSRGLSFLSDKAIA